MTYVSAISAMSLFVLIAAADADAQYFGRNKVEYGDFAFRILTTEHFEVYYYRREERAAYVAAGSTGRIHAAQRPAMPRAASSAAWAWGCA